MSANTDKHASYKDGTSFTVATHPWPVRAPPNPHIPIPLLSFALSPPVYKMALKRKLERDTVSESDRDVGSSMGIAVTDRD